MMHNLKLSLFLVPIIFLLITPCYANMNVPDANWYLSGNLGAGLGAGVDKSSGQISGGIWGIGGNVFFGRQFNKNFAVEAGGTIAGSTFATFYIPSLDIKGIIPLSPSFSLFGKLGGAVVITDFCLLGTCDTTTQVAPFVGAGINLNLSKNLSTSLEYNGFVVANKAADGLMGLLTLGLTLHFS